MKSVTPTEDPAVEVEADEDRQNVSRDVRRQRVRARQGRAGQYDGSGKSLWGYIIPSGI